MIKFSSFILLVFVLPVEIITAQITKDMSWTHKVGASTFPASKKIFNTADYGVVNDTAVTNTIFIQKAIDDCAKKGGGIVVFRPGTYVTGSLFIKSNVQLRIGKGVMLLLRCST